MHTCTMGDQRSRVRGRNDLYSYRYTSLSVRVTINGVTGRMIADKSGVNVDHIYLPMQKSDIYFYPGKDRPNYIVRTRRSSLILIGIKFIRTKTATETSLRHFKRESFMFKSMYLPDTKIPRIRNGKTTLSVSQIMRDSWLRPRLQSMVRLFWSSIRTLSSDLNIRGESESNKGYALTFLSPLKTVSKKRYVSSSSTLWAFLFWYK